MKNKTLLLVCVLLLSLGIIQCKKFDDTSGEKKVDTLKEEHEDHEHESPESHGSSEEESSHDHEEGTSEEGHEHEDSKIGSKKAITEVDAKKGFRLSKEAIASLGVELKSISSNQLLISKESLVSSKDLKGVYLYRDGYFRFVPIVQWKEESKSSYRVEIPDHQFGDQLVVKGVSSIRLSDIFSKDTSDYGHSH